MGEFPSEKKIARDEQALTNSVSKRDRLIVHGRECPLKILFCILVKFYEAILKKSDAQKDSKDLKNQPDAERKKKERKRMRYKKKQGGRRRASGKRKKVERERRKRTVASMHTKRWIIPFHVRHATERTLCFPIGNITAINTWPIQFF